jgi:Glutamate/Leucine/Phenylalanine/Valine dehydrogenase
VHTRKLSTVDGFIVVDLDDAPVATGIVRQGPKILAGGAEDLARSLTYTFASLGMARSGASCGINAPDDAKADAIAAFVAEVAMMAGAVLVDPGKGVTAADLAALQPHDPRTPITNATRDALIAAGAIAAAAHALGDLAGRRVAIEGFTASSKALVAGLVAHGATVVGVSTAKGSVRNANGFSAEELAQGAALVGESADPAFKVLGVDCDVLFVGSKTGAIDDKGAPFITAKAVVPTGALPVTAKALAALRRAGVAVYPDFVTLAGPVLAAWNGAGRSDEQLSADTAAAVGAILDELAGHVDGPLLAACYRAEAFLSTWQPRLPFGRPLAA